MVVGQGVARVRVWGVCGGLGYVYVTQDVSALVKYRV